MDTANTSSTVLEVLENTVTDARTISTSIEMLSSTNFGDVSNAFVAASVHEVLASYQTVGKVDSVVIEVLMSLTQRATSADGGWVSVSS